MDDVSLTPAQHRALLVLLWNYSAFVDSDGSEAKTAWQGVPRTEWDVPLSIALLRYFGRVGHRRALPHLRRLADAVWKQDQRDALEVTMAAAAAVKEIERLSAIRQPGKILLRAAAAPVGEGRETLLRAARDDGQTHGDELLRPTPEPRRD